MYHFKGVHILFNESLLNLLIVFKLVGNGILLIKGDCEDVKTELESGHGQSNLTPSKEKKYTYITYTCFLDPQYSQSRPHRLFSIVFEICGPCSV